MFLHLSVSLFIGDGLCPGGSLSKRGLCPEETEISIQGGVGVSVQEGLCQGDPHVR